MFSRHMRLLLTRSDVKGVSTLNLHRSQGLILPLGSLPAFSGKSDPCGLEVIPGEPFVIVSSDTAGSSCLLLALEGPYPVA